MARLSLHPAPVSHEDLSVLQSEGGGLIEDVSTQKVNRMILGDSDIDVFGRMANGLDVSEFDARTPLEADQEGDPEEMEVFLGDGEDVPAPFQPPEEHFPLFKEALHHFQAQASQPRTLRVDTEETFGHFVAEKAVKEIERRVNELRHAVEEHTADHHGPKMTALRTWDEVLGAADAVADLSASKTHDEALSKMPEVPLDLPEWADGKARAWKDGDVVICCVCFSTAEGEPRVATMAAQPKVSEEAVVGLSRVTGMHPITILGAVEHLADSACAKKLVKEIAGAALEASRRADVCVMGDEPVMLTSTGNTKEAPIKALVHLHELAGAGDAQAQSEVAKLEAVASTQAGQVVAAPALIEARKRLAAKVKAKKPTLFQRLLGWVKR